MGLFGRTPDPGASSRGGLFGGTRSAGRPQLYTLLATGVLTYLASHPQALHNLLGRFQSSGLGHKVDSWVGTGPNDSIHPHEVEAALGPDGLDRIAHEAGVKRDEARDGLTQVIPNVVDKLTPHGEVPPPSILQQGISFLRNSLMHH
jgi:uncharacterized protein YidB (DUF937 family)